jgi:hypothetical protein
MSETTRARILEKAKELICKDRNGQYGEPMDNFAVIAELWGTYLSCRSVPPGVKVDLEPADVGMMMGLFKAARYATADSAMADTFIDMAGYVACAAECAGIRAEDVS